ncbi:hypothetical protein BGW38_006511 [Lunasporangiospora selenospora]|uniref:U3 small nucleolar RNA-associated protein 22 n=1 Tax=Lunasporangiospora selenospora TaxID=979761 RepID=A0A9P6FYZ6_9FUNG|nr:hypothetical protein BGW38_006511 [Lunasporangiospora selenospora]
MVQPRRFHSNFLFFIPLTQGVLLITVLDFIKNAVYFSKQAHNLDPTTVVATDGQQVVRRSKDPAYVAAQYIYAIWLALMMLKAIVGFRANLKFNVRWMGIYNILFGCDTLFEFIRTTLGVIFQDLSQLDEGAVIRYYCANYSLAVKVAEPETESSAEEYDDMIDEEEDDSEEEEDEEEEGDYIEGEDEEMDSDVPEEEDEQDEFMAAAEMEANVAKKSSGMPSQKPSAKAAGAKPTSSALYKAPTNEEIQGLQESSDLFKSNIFKLQIEELLKEVHLDYKKTQPLEAALRKLKQIFDATPVQSDLSLSAIRTNMKKKSIVIPFPTPAPSDDIQYTFGYQPPSSMHLVGSYPLKTVSKSRDNWSVDVAVEMPEELLQEKDHMNYRYFYKRAYYLAVLASAIQDKKSAMSKCKLEFATMDGDQRRPVLIIHPSGDKSEIDFKKMRCTIRIIPFISTAVFPAQRLAPGRNNVRLENAAHQPATPQYNTALQQETAFTSHLAFLYQQSKACPAFKDGCVLLKVWAGQRGLLRRTSDGISGFLLQMMMAYLLQGGGANGGKKLANGFSSYQLVRGTIDFIAQHDFAARPIFMGQHSSAGEFSKEEFTANYDVVVVDPSGKINLAGHVSKANLEELQHEARLAMTFFMESSDDKFEDLFLKRVDNTMLRFDNVVKISVPKKIVQGESKAYTKEAALDQPVPYLHFTHAIAPLLKRGLSDRIHLVTTRYEPLGRWAVSSAPSKYTDEDAVVTIGLLLNHEQSSRLVDLGPPADDLEAAAIFRTLWGNRAELRRFKDGSILESAVWEAQGTDARQLIVGQMISYLLKFHHEVPQEGVHYWAGQLNKFIQYNNKVVSERLFDNKVAAAGGFQSAVTAFEALTKAVKQAEDMPLSVTHMYFTSPAARLSSTFIPQPRDLNGPANLFPDSAQFVEPMDVVIQFESSQKWPDNLKAIQRMKTAFYLRMATRLKAKGMNTTVVEEMKDESLGVNGYMEVKVEPGFAFRCRISHDREIALCEKVIADRKVSHSLKEQHQAALDHYERLFVQAPMHTFQVHALCHRHPSMSQTIRLTKRWVSAHWLAPFLKDEALELIAASVYVNPAPWSAPASGFTGFLRVLNLLAHWDWQQEALVVDLTGEMTGKEREEIRHNFANIRKNKAVSSAASASTMGEHASMYIATGKDTSSKWWTWDAPTPMILSRLRALAKSSLEHLNKATGTTASSLKPLFVTPTVHYDLVIDLDPSLCTRYAQNLSPDAKYFATKADKYRNLGAFQKSVFGDEVMIGFDPAAEYLAELQRAFGDIALFFYDRYGGTQVGILWNPVALAPRSWKVNLGFNNKPADVNQNGDLESKDTKGPGSKLVVPNIEALMSEMQRLGHGLVQSLQIHRNPFQSK